MAAGADNTPAEQKQRGQKNADGCQKRPAEKFVADGIPVGEQASVEQNEHEGNGADVICQTRILKVYAAGAVDAGHHSQSQKK